MSEVTSELTAADVRAKCFGKPPLGKRGYDEKSVNDLLALVARRLDGRGHLSADDVRTVRFPKPPLFQRGYHDIEVDDYLQRVVAALSTLEQQRPQE